VPSEGRYQATIFVSGWPHRAPLLRKNDEIILQDEKYQHVWCIMCEKLQDMRTQSQRMVIWPADVIANTGPAFKDFSQICRPSLHNNLQRLQLRRSKLQQEFCLVRNKLPLLNRMEGAGIRLAKWIQPAAGKEELWQMSCLMSIRQPGP